MTLNAPIPAPSARPRAATSDMRHERHRRSNQRTGGQCSGWAAICRGGGVQGQVDVAGHGRGDGRGDEGDGIAAAVTASFPRASAWATAAAAASPAPVGLPRTSRAAPPTTTLGAVVTIRPPAAGGEDGGPLRHRRATETHSRRRQRCRPAQLGELVRVGHQYDPGTVRGSERAGPEVSTRHGRRGCGMAGQLGVGAGSPGGRLPESTRQVASASSARRGRSARPRGVGSRRRRAPRERWLRPGRRPRGCGVRRGARSTKLPGDPSTATSAANDGVDEGRSRPRARPAGVAPPRR